MKRLSEPRHHNGANAWGADSPTIRTAYVVEQSDVGTFRANYGGFGQPPKLITQQDVGRVLEVITCPRDRAYTCWGWGSIFDDIPKRVEV